MALHRHFHTQRFLVAILLLCATAFATAPFFELQAVDLSSEAETLLSDLNREFGKAVEYGTEIRDRTVRLTLALRPTFQALPKTDDNRLEQPAVRYLLHRYFVDHHGWYVKGLETSGQMWNISSPAAVFEKVGRDLRHIFEERMDSRGLDLQEVAVFAATLEVLVHHEVSDRFSTAHRMTRTSRLDRSLSEQDVVRAIDTYMLLYVLGQDFKRVSPKSLRKMWNNIDRVYPTWGNTKRWIREVREEITKGHPNDRTSPRVNARVLEEIADRYGRWQNEECLQLKASLLKLEEPGTGRVPLASFYGSALKGNWQFSESKSYLRQAGALDETDPHQPSVIISNYILAPANCVASSRFYSVCCINECEALLGSIEKEVAAPDAEPQRIVKFVGKLLQAPRRLTDTLIQRLDDIAFQHDGSVPLHSRLFMQWLHHAFPHECPFPHLAGSTKPLSPNQWVKTGESPTESPESMRRLVARHNSSRISSVKALPWNPTDELYVPHHHMEISIGFLQVLLLVAVVMAFSVVWTLGRSLRSKAVVSQPSTV